VSPSRPDKPIPTGLHRLHQPRLNKGTAFSEEEQLFYRLIIDHLSELMPIIYTPTVGEACQQFGDIFRRPRGLYVTIEDRGSIRRVLSNWPTRDVDVIVVTDGERILGLGDLGAQGMGIPIGKLALYSACAGIDPARCLPITLDVGTDTATLRERPFYTGLQRARVRGQEYDAFLDEFVEAVAETFPMALLQFEDFATENALRLLARYRDRYRTFNDDIQGTAAVTLAGLYSAARAVGSSLREQRVLFYGAGSAAAGIADLIVLALRGEGLSEEEARGRCWFFDSKGLVVRTRSDLAAHKRPYAHEHALETDLAAAIRSITPTALLGVSAQAGAFGTAVLEAMGSVNPRPIIFPLSNPTSKAECTADDAYRVTGGRAVFASGSPYPEVELNGTRFVPRQANNAYVFPGIGLGVVLSRARRVTDAMFLVAARTLSDMVAREELDRGSLFPPLEEIRAVSRKIASAVIRVAEAERLVTKRVPEPREEFIASRMYDPRYP
jgi:malate dehydrogenase (oxaloacetate-decarboxylating)(NADP+)